MKKQFDLHLPKKYAQYRINGGIWKNSKPNGVIRLENHTDRAQFRTGFNDECGPRVIDLRPKQ